MVETSAMNIDDSATAPMASFQLTKKTMDLDKSIEDHAHGKFSYITLLPSKEVSKKTVVWSLIKYFKAIGNDPIDVGDMPIIYLNKRRHAFSLSSGINARQLAKCKNWINVNEVKINFNPAQGYFDATSTVDFLIYDGRYTSEPIVRSITCSTNAACSGVLSLDYSVYKGDLKKIQLVIMNEQNIIANGSFWGTVRIQVKLLQNDEAAQAEFRPTKAMVGVYPSSVARPKYNPRTVNVAVNPHNHKKLQSMYAQNQLADLGEPEDRQKKREYAGSVAGASSDRDSLNSNPQSDEQSDENVPLMNPNEVVKVKDQRFLILHPNTDNPPQISKKKSDGVVKWMRSIMKPDPSTSYNHVSDADQQQQQQQQQQDQQETGFRLRQANQQEVPPPLPVVKDYAYPPRQSLYGQMVQEISRQAVDEIARKELKQEGHGSPHESLDSLLNNITVDPGELPSLKKKKLNKGKGKMVSFETTPFISPLSAAIGRE